jgi:Flp pilus assembly protein TadB
MRTARPSVVITDAEQSQDKQLRSRQIRYLVMMTVRAACLIVAAVLVSMRVPMLGLWVALCVLAMILLPWLAVLIANDRPAKPEHRLINRVRPSPPAPSNAVTESGEPKVIDVEL